LTPSTAEVHARLALSYFQQGKFSDAIPSLREAMRLKPGLPQVDALLGLSLSELGRYEEALPAVSKAFSQSSDRVLRRMAGLHLQRIYTGLGRDRDAVEIALRLSGLYPDDPEVLYHSGRLFANYAYLQTMRLATVAPDSVWLHQAAGEANESQGLYDAALREYRQVLAAAPRRPGIHFRIGRVLLERSASDSARDDRVEARRAFEEELALDPTNANAAYELGEMHRKAGELELARQRFAQAVTHYAGFEHALIGLARTLTALGRPESRSQGQP
jgi:tetratricopeptide (TPR) repeat protein